MCLIYPTRNSHAATCVQDVHPKPRCVCACVCVNRTTLSHTCVRVPRMPSTYLLCSDSNPTSKPVYSLAYANPSIWLMHSLVYYAMLLHRQCQVAQWPRPATTIVQGYLLPALARQDAATNCPYMSGTANLRLMQTCEYSTRLNNLVATRGQAMSSYRGSQYVSQRGPLARV